MNQNLKYHHLGIPTNEKREGEKYLKEHKVYISGYETSEYKIEWMRYEDDSPVNELVKTVPHVAFEVNDVYEATKGKEILIQPNSLSPGVTVAFIIENGAPVEFLQIDKSIMENP